MFYVLGCSGVLQVCSEMGGRDGISIRRTRIHIMNPLDLGFDVGG